MVQVARNLIDHENGFLKDKRILIHDRDPLYTKKFSQTLRTGGVRALKIPRCSPNLNAHAESFVSSIRREMLNNLILFGERGVRHAIEQFVEHYHLERPRKNLSRRIIQSQAPPTAKDGTLPLTSGEAVSLDPSPSLPTMVPPDAMMVPPPTVNEIRCRERLGGLLRSYYRQAA